ncbi:hypothetical protein BN2475_130071 [Paraburkholderia ribeironis]|uniref:Uncharacterized protein n=1 Tax=Paraburkholderia ribeironis TaxID=1247936 RepID=A0A1N7RSE1_9BURK|nr:hypothetical protein BN2475_130071 [Paraburkholderia ribeironis]
MPDLASRLEHDDGVVSLTLRFVHPRDAVVCRATLKCGAAVSSLQWCDAYALTGNVRVLNAKRWWPHAHDELTLYTCDVATR